MASQEVRKPFYKIFGNRAEYKKETGQEAPAFDERRKIKRWFDPQAGSTGLPRVRYENCVLTDEKSNFVLVNGLPVVWPIEMPVTEAASVNLPPEDPSGNTAIQPYMLPEVQAPSRAPGPDEVIMVAGPDMGLLNGQVLIFRNTKLWAEEQAAISVEEGKFTAADRNMLKALCAKFGVTV